MKNIYKLLLLVVVAFAFASCNKTTTDNVTTASPTTTASLTTENVTTEVTTVNFEPVFAGLEDHIVLVGSDPIDYESGVTASDEEDGDLTSLIDFSGDVDYDTVDDYVITVSVTDEAGQTVTDTFLVRVISQDEANARTDIAAITLDINDLSLPTTGENGSSFYWKSDRPDVITKKGFIIQPGIGQDPVTVTLTATVINATYRGEASFQLTVQPHEPIDGVITSRSVAFEGTSEEYVCADVADVPLYFVDDGALPYIDIETFLNLIDGAIDSSLLVFTPVGEDGLSITYDAEYEDFDGSTVTDSFSAYVDFTENTFTVNNYGFFSYYIADTTSDYGEGLNYVDADYIEGHEVTIPLGYYNFDLLIYDDGTNVNYLMPLHVADLLFAGDIYYDVYYNGDQLYGIDTFTVSSSDEEALALVDQIRTSSYNDDVVPEDIRWATYEFMGLAFDYFYGLRDTYDVDTYLEILSARAQSMITAYNDISFYSQVFYAAYDMDDLHTSHAFTGYYEEPYNMTLYLNDLGPSTIDFYNGLWDMQDLLTAKFGSYNSLPSVRTIDDGKTAIIYLTEFTIDTPDHFKSVLDSLAPTVENVVVDLSYNTGGNVGAVLRIFGYMTEEPIQYHSMNPADGSKSTYYIESDYTAYDYDWYIMTSSVTFSAANLMTSIAKEQGIATIIGKNSSGGASSIGAIYLPDGSSLIISTNNVLSTIIDDQYVSVEDGIQVDYQIYNVTSDDLVIQAINQAKADRES